MKSRGRHEIDAGLESRSVLLAVFGLVLIFEKSIRLKSGIPTMLFNRKLLALTRSTRVKKSLLTTLHHGLLGRRMVS